MGIISGGISSANNQHIFGNHNNNVLGRSFYPPISMQNTKVQIIINILTGVVEENFPEERSTMFLNGTNCIRMHYWKTGNFAE